MVMLEFCRERFLLCMFSCALALTGAAEASVLEFHTDLNGICAGTGSPATGSGTFTLDTTTGLLEWVIVHDDLETGELGAHIHGPEFSEICGLHADAEVLAFLSRGSPKIGSVTLNAQEQQDFVALRYYINVHSNGMAPAEIRGEIKFVPPPVPTASLWGLTTLALMVLTGATIGIRRQV